MTRKVRTAFGAPLTKSVRQKNRRRLPAIGVGGRSSNAPQSRADAGARFAERTGLNPERDRVVRRVVVAAGKGAVFQSIQDLEMWGQPLRKCLRQLGEPAGIPQWALDALVDAEGQASLELEFNPAPEGAAEAPVNLVGLVQSICAHVTALTEDLRKLRTAEFRLSALQTHGSVTGRYLEPRKRGRPPEIGKGKFARALNLYWLESMRDPLSPEDVALLAVWIGIETLPISDAPDRSGTSDWERCINRWRVYLQDHAE